MCLDIDKSVKPSKVNKEGYCVGYKVVQVAKNVYHGESVFGYYKKYKYVVGEKISSRENIELTNDETTSQCIFEGFHLFTTRDEARSFRKGRCEKDHEVRIIRVYYKPEDVVDYGFFIASKGFFEVKYKCVVVHKLLVKSLKAIR